MTEFVRVTDPVSKAHVTVAASFAERLNLTPLKSDAVDRAGRPLPAKQRVDLRSASAGSQDAPSSDTTTKEK
jgi:hypothetical protein